MAIGEHTKASETSPVPLSRVPVTPNWHALLESLAGTDRSWPVGLDDPEEKMRIYSDPGGLCMPAIYELRSPDDPPSKRPSIEVGDITNAAVATAYIGPPRRVYVVDVDTCVGSGFPVGYDYVVVERELGEYGIMLHQFIYDWLERGSYGRNGERLDLRRVHFLDYAPLAVPMGDDDGQPLLKAVDATVLKRLVLTRATAMDGRMYSLPDLDAAIRVVLDGGRTDSAADLWGVRVAARTAVPVIPGVLLGLAVSLLYRVRRIGPSGHLLNEPWIAVRPRGVVEATAAITWAISLFAAALSVTWVVLVYQWQAGTGLDRTVEPWSLGPFAGTFLPLCLAANLVSVLVLWQACRHLLTLNRATANPPRVCARITS